MEDMPYVRCVGVNTHVYQNTTQKAYDYRMIFILSCDGIIEMQNSKYVTRAKQIYIIEPGTSFRVCSSVNQKIAVVNYEGTYEYSHISEPVLSVDEELFEQKNIMYTQPLMFSGKFEPVMPSDKMNLIDELYHTYLRNDLSASHKEMLLSSQLLY